ncbi:MAG TPA: chemotaxis response regulator protein-glutamate methylesterase [Candidatus Kapabacteria bacterium]|nr:chemotaxis response regulator protein-glutamate methylesterase [Candidatus Kapabacteria bacterium]
MVKVRVLVVEDSFFMRQAIVRILNHPDIEVIDTAKNGKEAVEKVLELKPDVVTMDIEMPVMNGLDALKEIMSKYPTPVIMFSTLTSEGADTTVEALSEGAVDFIAKRPAFQEMDSLRDEVLNKVLSIGKNDNLKNQLIRMRLLRRMSSNTPKSNTISFTHQIASKSKANETSKTNKSNKPRPKANEIGIIGIGISTGGPKTLNELLVNLPENISVPIVIVQHMPPKFTKSLAQRLDSTCKIKVKEAEEGDKLFSGTVFIIPGGFQVIITKKLSIELIEENSYLFKPSVDYMFDSIIKVYGKSALGIIMTGMGNDGQKSFEKLHSIGGYVIAQSPESCTIAGMPKSVIDAGAADEILNVNEISNFIKEIFGN